MQGFGVRMLLLKKILKIFLIINKLINILPSGVWEVDRRVNNNPTSEKNM